MPPSCPIKGRHLRYGLLAGITGYLIYFLYIGISHDPTASNKVYICNTNQMIECTSSNDISTCSSFTDANGNEASCIESSCGYKLFDHIDVSIAGSSDPLSKEKATSPHSLLTVFAVAYSLIPYAAALLYLVLFLSTGSLVPATRFVVLGIIAILNEAVFKRIVKEERPIGSCLYFQSYGMPSGHAETSIGLLAYILLEMFTYHPNIICGLSCQRDNSRQYSFQLGFGWIRGINTNTIDSSVIEQPLQLSQHDVEEGYINDECQAERIGVNAFPSSSKWSCHICALLYTIIFLPVPFSRIYLHDHYRDQVLIGAFVGIIVSTLGYLGLMRGLDLYGKMSKFSQGNWGQWWGLRSDWNWGIL